MELESVTRDIYRYIKEEMNHSNDFEMGTNIIEGGLVDSTGILALVIFLETRYSIEIDLEDINEENFAQVGAIAEFVKKLMG